MCKKFVPTPHKCKQFTSDIKHQQFRKVVFNARFIFQLLVWKKLCTCTKNTRKYKLGERENDGERELFDVHFTRKNIRRDLRLIYLLRWCEAKGWRLEEVLHKLRDFQEVEFISLQNPRPEERIQHRIERIYWRFQILQRDRLPRASEEFRSFMKIYLKTKEEKPDKGRIRGLCLLGCSHFDNRILNFTYNFEHHFLILKLFSSHFLRFDAFNNQIITHRRPFFVWNQNTEKKLKS